VFLGEGGDEGVWAIEESGEGEGGGADRRRGSRRFHEVLRSGGSTAATAKGSVPLESRPVFVLCPIPLLNRPESAWGVPSGGKVGGRTSANRMCMECVCVSSVYVYVTCP